MTYNLEAPWHKTSYERFLNESLPQLLAERLPLLSYSVAAMETYISRVVVTLGSHTNAVDVSFDLPTPDDKGLFNINDVLTIVVPIADRQELDKAEIKCVGEQIYDYIATRLGQASTDLPWDVPLVRAWLPLDIWIGEYMVGVGDHYIPAQRADTTNWLALHTHLRRLIIPEYDDVIGPGQLGYVCPFETPEGPYVGHILTIAVGAEIRDGRMVKTDNRPEATLGITASMVPLLEHSDPNRMLMGVNMMRQWVPQRAPEPALVQTGLEPDTLLTPEFWTGRNLLTAYVSWGVGTYEDGIIISKTCAHRFDTPYSLQVGDKLSNRHGTKGVVSQILPDDEMPHLADGTAVDLVFNFVNIHRRMNFGQVREAVLGRIARINGDPVIVPPFCAPTSEGLLEDCKEAGLPQSGMENLTLGRHGPSLEKSSTSGWVYWGRLFHLAKDKLKIFVQAEPRWGQRVGEMETYMLRYLGAYENITESLNTRSIRHRDASTLATRVAKSPVEHALPPTPLFEELVHRLNLAGIEPVLDDECLAFSFAPSTGKGYKLAHPVPHPWLPGRHIDELALPIPEGDASDGFVPGTDVLQLVSLTNAIIEANERLDRILVGQIPEKLVEKATDQLVLRIREYFEALLLPSHLRLGERVHFSGRAILVPGSGITLQQLGIPESMAWELFEAMLVRELKGDVHAVTARTDTAVRALDALMARSWVILNRAPTFEPTALLAFHPVRVESEAMHLNPLVCRWMNADFDGDQAALYLPITESGQYEAGARLSVAAHLERDPNLISSLVPTLDVLWGLTYLSMDPNGLREITEIVGGCVNAPSGILTHDSLVKALTVVLERDGVEIVLESLERLMWRGFEVAQASGASISPFLGADIQLPDQPQHDNADAWSRYSEMVNEIITSLIAYKTLPSGPQLLMVKTGGRGLELLTKLISGHGPVKDACGKDVMVRHTYIDGLTPTEMFANVAGARRGIASLHAEWSRMGAAFREQNVSQSWHVIPRALRAKHPGLVFARAAANNEVDPLTDVESRILVGLPID